MARNNISVNILAMVQPKENETAPDVRNRCKTLKTLKFYLIPPNLSFYSMVHVMTGTLKRKLIFWVPTSMAT